jgi:hypothetical protein
MRLTRKFLPLASDRRPQDPRMNGARLRFETMDHGGEYMRQRDRSPDFHIMHGNQTT